MALSKETINYTRCCYVAVEIFPEILRRILQKDIPPQDIKVRTSGLRNLRDDERLLLEDATSQGYSNFDVTFLYKVIRNINLPSVTAPSNGWGKLPTTSSNNNIGDAIERIRDLRNKVYSHASSSKMTNNDFNQYWSKFRDICQNVDSLFPMSDPTFVSLLNGIEKTEFCGEMHQKIVEVVKRHTRYEVQIEDLYKRVAEVSVKNTEASQQQSIPQEEQKGLENTLVHNYHNATQCIPLIPLGKVSLPLSQLFSPTVVEENIKSNETMEKIMQTEKIIIKNTAQIFFDDEGKPFTRIFMKGEAGRGKTVYGLRLLEEWCKVKQGKHSDMQEVLSQFGFLFYVSMRHVEPNRIQVVEMICDSLSEDDPCLVDLIKRVLCNKDIRCLVVLDGLDEWSSNSDCFPKTTGLVNCVLFTTSRPWKLEKLQMDYTPQNKVVEILGINPESDATLIKRIVTALIGSDDHVLKDRLISYCEQRARSLKMKDLMKLPMILTASCYVWCEEETKESGPVDKKNDDKSMTYFSLAVIDMLIQRAEKNNKEVRDYLVEHLSEQTEPKSKTDTMTAFLSQYFPKVIDFHAVLTPFCKVAYDDLMSNETRLVFRKDQLERKMGRSIVELALKVGVVSQCWAPGKGINIQNVSVSFFHKLIQELMAAMHIVCNPDLLQTFCHQCDTIDKIRGLSNVIMYLAGLDSSIVLQLSHHIVRLAQTDQDILLWRETMKGKVEDKVRSLYHSQCDWYNEMDYVSTLMGMAIPTPFHHSDVYLIGNDSEVVRVTGEIMRNTDNTVVSVYLWGVSYISHIIQNLPQHSISLTALCIMHCDVQSTKLLAAVLPKLTQLRCIQYIGENREVDAGVVAALTRLARLKYVELKSITLSKATLSVSCMTKLEMLELYHIHMSAVRWGEFLSRLMNVSLKVKVILGYTNIDHESIAMIQSSPQFTIVMNNTEYLEFYRET